MELLQKFIAQVRPKGSIRWHEWQYVLPNTDKQTDSNSCGVHVCLYAEIMLTGKRQNMKLGPEEIKDRRVHIAHKILTARKYLDPFIGTLSKGTELKSFVTPPARVQHPDWQGLLIDIGTSARAR